MFTYLSNDVPKVFGIGLSRTGTTSLNKALNMLGLRAFHWSFPPENRILRIEDAYYCDAITDINAAWCFETLARMFLRAKFLYTTRPVDAWAESVAQHYSAATPLILKNRMMKSPATETPAAGLLHHSPVYHAIHHALYTGHATWRAAYENHDRIVRNFFANSERFMEFDIFERGHGWNELCTFLEKSIPTEAYPNVVWKAKRDSQT